MSLVETPVFLPAWFGNASSTVPYPVTASSEKGSDGYCGPWNRWFIVFLAIGAASFLFGLGIDYLRVRGPKPGVVSYGRPWAVVHLLVSILTWNTLPNAAAFALFDLALRDVAVFEDAKRFACVAVWASVPYFGFFFALQGFLFLVVYRPKQLIVDSARLLFPDDRLRAVCDGMTSAQRASFASPVVLVFGALVRGNVYLDVTQRVAAQFDESEELRKLHNRPRVILADVDGTGGQWASNNADARGIFATNVIEVVSVGGLHGTAVNDDVLDDVNASRSLATMPGEEGSPLRQRRDSDMLYGSVQANPTDRRRRATADPNDRERALMLAGSVPTVPFAIGAPLASVDLIVAGPFVRKIPPIGDFVTPAATTKRHFEFVAAEFRRVLRPGGKVRIIDSLMDCLSCEADLANAGFRITLSTSATHCKTGAIFFMQAPMYVCEAENVALDMDVAEHIDKRDEAVVNALGGTISGALRAVPSAPRQPTSQATFNRDTSNSLLAPSSPHHASEIEAARILIEQEAASPTAAVQRRAVYTATSGSGWAVLVLAQLFFFVVLLFIFGFAAKGLDIPTKIIMGARVGAILLNVATSYPLMAYFTRMVAGSHPPTTSVVRLVSGILKTEVVAVIGSVFLTAIISLPQFGIQYALSDTSLSDDSRSYIGIAISVLIGVILYKWSRKRGEAAPLKLYGISEARYQSLQTAGK